MFEQLIEFFENQQQSELKNFKEEID
jgi:hypothetical protein